MIECSAFSWEAFAILVTGLAAVLGAFYVGKKQIEILDKQADIQRQSLKHDLFERRLGVYAQTRELIDEIFRTGKSPNPDISKKFLVAKNEAEFIFDCHIVTDLEEIWKKVCYLQYLSLTMDGIYSAEGTYGDGNPEKWSETLEWFSNRLTTLPSLFHVMKLGEWLDKQDT